MDSLLPHCRYLTGILTFEQNFQNNESLADIFEKMQTIGSTTWKLENSILKAVEVMSFIDNIAVGFFLIEYMVSVTTSENLGLTKSSCCD